MAEQSECGKVVW